MISNSRLVTQNTAFGSEVSPSIKVADTYSDRLMDDLFTDVDQILEGDLSSYRAVVGHQPKLINSSKTVQLPPDFVPRSAADLYRATVVASAARTPQYQSVQAVKLTHKQPTNRSNEGAYSSGGRPVTAAASSLARLGNLQTAVIQSPNVGPNNNPDGNLDSNSASPVQTVSNYLYPNEPLPELALAQLALRPQQQVSLPLLLVGAASIAAVSTLGLWTLSQSAPANGWLLSLRQEATAAEIPDNSTADFLAYLQQSLEVITARQDRANQTVAVIPAASKAPMLPTTVPNINAAPPLGTLPNLPGAATTPGVIERVFVPLYQSSQAAQPSAKAGTAPLPPVASSNRKRPTVPVPAPVAAAAAIPLGASATAMSSVPTVQSGRALPAPSIPIAVAPTNAAAAVANSRPNSEHVLVGILNLGSRSAALFNVDGNSQRAYVGDRVGVSEWSLVSVNGQDVVVRRDGEVRSIYIGQRF